MATDDPARYAALIARDRRFDGRFYVGVTSTGIYCRPICRVRTPKLANCRFFPSAAAAEAAGFRPCLRCRPELAPGQGAIDFPSRLAWAAARRIEGGQSENLAVLAARLGISDRHLRRIFLDTFGVTPVAYAQTQRLLLAKRLLTETALPMTEVALAAGFGSLRRFNHLFRQRYGLAPQDVRRSGKPPAGEGLHLQLSFRPPFDWPRLLAFLAYRRVAGVEEVAGDLYRRSVRFCQGDREWAGWLEVALAPAGDGLTVTVSPDLAPALPAVLAGVGRLCDLGCDPQAVAAVLGPLAADAPGMRVPGAFDGFEMAVRAIFGQQVTVQGAHRLAGSFAQRFGDPVATPFPEVHRLFPTAQRVAELAVEDIAAVGIPRSRAQAILGLAKEMAAGRLDLGPAADVAATVAQLQALPGIGRWTAQYIALRALGWPDAWPSGDVGLIKALGVGSAREADAAAEIWRPWRAYATLHLWRRLTE